MVDVTEKLKPCPFCGKPPVRVSVGTASCDGMVDGVEIHNTIGMRPECWNTRHSASQTDEGVVDEERLAAKLLAAEVETTVGHAMIMLRDPEYDGESYFRMARAAISAMKDNL